MNVLSILPQMKLKRVKENTFSFQHGVGIALVLKREKKKRWAQWKGSWSPSHAQGQCESILHGWPPCNSSPHSTLS